MTRRDTIIYWTGFGVIMALLIAAPLVLPAYWSRFVTEILIWGLLLVVLFAAVAGVAIAVPAVLAAKVSSYFAILYAVVVPALLVAAIWVGVKLYYFAVAAMVSPTGTSPIRTSFQLVKGRWWSTFGRALLLLVIIWGISIVGNLLIQVVGQVAIVSSLHINQVTGEIQVDGQDISTLDTVDFSKLLPSTGSLILLADLYAVTQGVAQAIGLSGAAGLYRRAGGPSALTG